MRISRAVVLAGFFALVATPARASTPIFSGTYTGGNNFSTVASISLSYDFVSQGIYMFTLDVTNLGSFGEVYREIGLINLPSGFSVQSYGCPSGWTAGAADLWGAGLGTNTAGCTSPLPAATYGLQANAGASFQFGIGGFANLAQVNGVGAGLYATGADLEAGCRNTKLGVGGTWASRDGTCGPTPTQPQLFTATLLTEPITVAPEPSSVILLATGLLGLLSFGYVRRRRGLSFLQDMA